MEGSGVCLAETAGLGSVYDCGRCGNVHVQVGPVTVTLCPQTYMEFVAMLSTSAANFELWLGRRRSLNRTENHDENSESDLQQD